MQISSSASGGTESKEIEMKASQKTIGQRIRAFSTHEWEARVGGLVLRAVGISIAAVLLYALS